MPPPTVTGSCQLCFCKLSNFSMVVSYNCTRFITSIRVNLIQSLMAVTKRRNGAEGGTAVAVVNKGSWACWAAMAVVHAGLLWQ